MSKFICKTRAKKTEKLPTLLLNFTVQQFEDGKVGEAFFPSSLDCVSGDCNLVMVSMNQCQNGVFYPKIETFTSISNSLKVSQFDQELIKIDLDNGINFLIKFKCKVLPDNRKICNQVTELSGSLIKNSSILKKIINVQYKIVNKDTLKLDCNSVLVN